MKLNRFYVKKQYTLNQEISLPEDTSHKLSNVLRAKLNDKIMIFNGENIEATCKIISIKKQGVTVIVEKIKEHNVESKINIHLGQAITKINKMELIIQKACELGVYSITPIISQRTVVKVHKDKIANKISHWEKIVISACEQCQRNYIPVINEPLKLEDWVTQMANNKYKNFILQPIFNSKTSNFNSSISNFNLTPKPINSDINTSTIMQKNSDFESNSNSKDISLLIGPEGGFTTTEVEYAINNSFLPMTLGPRILRAETAAITGISKIQILFGDI